MRSAGRPRGSRQPSAAAPTESASKRAWGWVAAGEVAAATLAVFLDVLIPTLVLLAMATLSLLVRRRGLGSLGLLPAANPGLVLKMLAFAAAWSLLQLGVTMPIANRISGDEQDVSDFAGLEGNLGLLAIYLILGWTLAALGEELAYRGYLLTRIREALATAGWRWSWGSCLPRSSSVSPTGSKG